MQNVEKRIVIFKNNQEVREGTNPDTRPDLRGNVVINGSKLFISLWKHNKDDKKTLGGKIQEQGSNTDIGDIIIWKAPEDSKSLLTGVCTVNGTQYDIELFGRKSDKIGVYWEGQIKNKEISQENETDELPL